MVMARVSVSCRRCSRWGNRALRQSAGCKHGCSELQLRNTYSGLEPARSAGVGRRFIPQLAL
eukprot:COSAG01_NODE_8596_length_2724_cov_1.993524_3_plen_62_part_00